MPLYNPVPAGSTSAAGLLQLDGTATDIQPAGVRAAGSSGESADAKHVHPPGSSFLCTPTQYAPAGGATLSTTSASMVPLSIPATTVASGSNGGEISAIASWSSPSAGVLDVVTTTGWPTSGTVNVAASGATTAVVTYTGTAAGQLTGCTYVSGSASGTVATGGAVTLTSVSVNTGFFTAPASGSVVVTAANLGILQGAASDVFAFGLCAHGTVTPMVCDNLIFNFSGNTHQAYAMTFLVTGLTPGSSYDFDLMFCAASGNTLSVFAQGNTSTTPTGGNLGGPIILTVQAV